MVVKAKEKKTLTAAERVRRLKGLKSGDEFAYKNVGFGLTSYEKGHGEVWRKGGKLFTSTFDSMGMEWNGETWVFDGGLGMKTYIALLEDVPEGELTD